MYVKDKILPKLSLKQEINDDKISSIEIAIVKNKKIINKTKNFSLNNFDFYLNNKKSFFIVDNGEYLNGLYVLKFSKPFEGAILSYQKEIDDKAENIVDTMLILNPILLFLLILAGSKLIDKILIPIKNITQTAKEISISDLSKTIPQPKYNDEIKRLIDSFNAMIKRLENGIEKIDKFNSDVSHELKTPLTVIKGEIEIALRREREPQYYHRSMQTILQETNQIQKIVEDLLLLTKYSKDDIEQSFQICSLDSILLETVDKFSLHLKNKKLNLHIQKIEPVSIKANPLLINTIFLNLLDNAIKYSKNGKNIYLSLYKKDDKIHFIIKDEGIGIPKDKIAKVTDRFYRVDKSRDKKINGFGIGLSIVKNSIELQKAQLKIDSAENKGTTVHIIF